MLKAFTLLFFWNFLLLFLIPYVFRHLSPPTNLVLQKPFKYQNVQLLKDITACIFLLSTFYTFGNIQLFLQNFPHSSLWGICQISICYNFGILSAIQTIQPLKCSAFSALSAFCFSAFQPFNFFSFQPFQLFGSTFSRFRFKV